MKKVSPKMLVQFYKNLQIISDDLFHPIFTNDTVLMKYLQDKIPDVSNISDHCKRICEFIVSRLDISLCDEIDSFGNFELKTAQPNKKISIGTMTEAEFNRIKREEKHIFEKSDPYAKIKNTLLVVYTKLSRYPDPYYYMNGWGLLNLETMSDRNKMILQDDYKNICGTIKHYCHSRDNVTDYLRRNGSISGHYLTLSYKGQGDWGYNYPAWGFQAKFMKLIAHA
jgi:hypothetical protein